MGERAGELYSWMFLFFTFFFAFAIFNILTGVFVEKAVQAAAPDREETVMQQRRHILDQAEEFREICHLLDLDESGTISLEEFKQNMLNPTMVAYMFAVGLEVHDVELFFRTMSGGSGAADAWANEPIDIDVFVEGCMAMKGYATTLDVQKQLYETRELSRKIDQLERTYAKGIN